MPQTLVRSDKYMAWIRGRPCCVSGSVQNVVAHHITMFAERGLGQKPSDLWCVPLRSDLHVDLHNMGERAFWKSQGMPYPHSLAVTYLCHWIVVEQARGFELLGVLNEFAAGGDV